MLCWELPFRIIQWGRKQRLLPLLHVLPRPKSFKHGPVKMIRQHPLEGRDTLNLWTPPEKLMEWTPTLQVCRLQHPAPAGARRITSFLPTAINNLTTRMQRARKEQRFSVVFSDEITTRRLILAQKNNLQGFGVQNVS